MNSNREIDPEDTSSDSRAEGARSPTPSDRSSTSSSTASSGGYFLSKGNIEPQKTTITRSVDGEQLTYDRELKGRGQDTFAGIFKDKNNKEYLIKVDNPGVCLAEATATNRILPASTQKVLNCATIGCLEINGKNQMISIQDLVTAQPGERVMPLDTIVYGEKRDPKSFISYEYANQKKIKSFLTDPNKITEDAKIELAYALYSRAALGDESVHLGQYMAIVNEENCVVGIRAIDLGARERFAVARNKGNDIDPTKTSDQYASILQRQRGKNYLTLLLQEPGLRNKYLDIWSNANATNITINMIENFRAQIDNIPDAALKEKALQEFLTALNKKAEPENKIILPKDQPLEDKIDLFISKYTKIVHNRCGTMQTKAAAQLTNTQKFSELKRTYSADKWLNSPHAKKDELAECNTERPNKYPR